MGWFDDYLIDFALIVIYWHVDQVKRCLVLGRAVRFAIGDCRLI